MGVIRKTSAGRVRTRLVGKEGDCARLVDGFLFRRAVGGTPETRDQSNPSSGYFASSFFTNSLTSFPSTLKPAALNLAIAFFITVPISFMVGDPISAMAARTPAATSSSPAALGR